MSEGTFRAIVAAVLLGALALAAVVVFGLLLRAPAPGPTPTPVATAPPTPRPTPTPSPAPTPTPGPAFEVEVTGVGDVRQGGTSAGTLVLRFVEPAIDAIPDAPGSLTLTLTDAAGAGGTITFAGTPSFDAPGSLGASVEVVAPNVLKISIVASDRFNVEPITVTGLGISASVEAALGPIVATLGRFEGSLASGATDTVLPSPGTVVKAP